MAEFTDWLAHIPGIVVALLTVISALLAVVAFGLHLAVSTAKTWVTDRIERIDAGLEQWAECHRTVKNIETTLQGHGVTFEAMAASMHKIELTQVGHDIELRVVKEKVEAHHGDIDVLKKSAEQNSRVIEDVQRWMYQSENKLAARS